MNRQYKSEHAEKNNAGIIFAHNIYGQDTNVHFMERSQGFNKSVYGDSNRIIFSIKFEDFNFNIISKVQDTNEIEGNYVKYALTLIEDNTLEEFYKTALLITKKRFEIAVKSELKAFEEMKRLYKDYTIEDSYKTRKQSVDTLQKILKTLDVEESDLLYFKSVCHA